MSSEDDYYHDDDGWRNKIMRTPDAVIMIKGNRYALYKKFGNSNPHMVALSTGEVPKGDQRFLLKGFLLEHGVDIEPWVGPNHRTTYWCINQAIKIAEKAN